eukprot:4355187-Prymnesium_polylepis.2
MLSGGSIYMTGSLLPVRCGHAGARLRGWLGCGGAAVRSAGWRWRGRRREISGSAPLSCFVDPRRVCHIYIYFASTRPL